MLVRSRHTGPQGLVSRPGRSSQSSAPLDSFAPGFQTTGLGDRWLPWRRSKDPFKPVWTDTRKMDRIAPPLRDLVAQDDAKVPAWTSDAAWRLTSEGMLLGDDMVDSLQTEVRTPPLSLQGAQESTLEADFRFGRLESQDGVYLEARGDDGQWVPLFARDQDLRGGRTAASYDLEPFLGQQIEFRFRVTGSPGARLPYLAVDRFSVRADDQVLFRSGKSRPEELEGKDPSLLTRVAGELGDLHEAALLVAELGDQVAPCHLEAVKRYGPAVCEGLSLMTRPEVEIHTLGLLTRAERRLPKPPEAEQRSQIRAWVAGAGGSQPQEALEQLRWAQGHMEPTPFWNLLTHLSERGQNVRWSEFPSLVRGMQFGGAANVDSLLTGEREIEVDEDYLMVGDFQIERNQ